MANLFRLRAFAPLMPLVWFAHFALFSPACVTDFDGNDSQSDSPADYPSSVGTSLQTPTRVTTHNTSSPKGANPEERSYRSSSVQSIPGGTENGGEADGPRPHPWRPSPDDQAQEPVLEPSVTPSSPEETTGTPATQNTTSTNSAPPQAMPLSDAGAL